MDATTPNKKRLHDLLDEAYEKGGKQFMAEVTPILEEYANMEILQIDGVMVVKTSSKDASQYVHKTVDGGVLHGESCIKMGDTEVYYYYNMGKVVTAKKIRGAYISNLTCTEDDTIEETTYNNKLIKFKKIVNDKIREIYAFNINGELLGSFKRTDTEITVICKGVTLDNIRSLYNSNNMLNKVVIVDIDNDLIKTIKPITDKDGYDILATHVDQLQPFQF